MLAPSYVGDNRHVIGYESDTVRSLHLDLFGLTAGEEDDSYQDVGAKSSTDAELTSSGADAAAGGCAGRRAVSESSARCGQRPRQGELLLRLPIEAVSSGTAGGRVASAGTVQMDRGLNSAAALHSRAMQAIDRISKQHAALRRFPMTCPTCGTLNAPPGLAWGAGDIVACQGCCHSFVPLGHGVQDGDLVLLRTAVQEMWVQSERAEHLELALSQQCQSSPQAASRPARSAGPTPHHRRSPVRRGGVAASGSHEGPPAELSREGSRSVSAAAPATTFGSGGPYASGDPASLEPKLVSLMDTQDLITNSSTGSRDTPCFYGRRLRHRQPTEDTHKGQNYLSPPGQPGPQRHRIGTPSPRVGLRDREEGEVTSASASDMMSDGEISSSSSLPMRRTPRVRLGAATPSSKNSATPSRRGLAAGSVEYHASPVTARSNAEALTQSWVSVGSGSIAGLRVALGQLLFLAIAFGFRSALVAVLGVDYAAAASAFLTATLSSGAFAAWRSAQRCMELETQRVMDTVDMSSDPKGLLSVVLGRASDLGVRFGGRFFPRVLITWSIEDSLCLAVTFAQLALLFFFENWGLQGPRAYRWVAVAGHAAGSLVLLLAASIWILPRRSSEPQKSTLGWEGGSGSALWLSLTLGQWACTSLAAATWWHSAAVAAAEAAAAAAALSNAPAVVVESVSGSEMLEPVLQHPVFGVHVPIVASTVTHVANIWSASRAREPLLLFFCVVLAGVSMAGSCCIHGSTPGLALMRVPWRASVLPLFCATSAWLLWQELVRSLSAD